MKKRTSISIVVVFVLASASQALAAVDICIDRPIYVNVGDGTEKCYFGCETIEVRGNFPAIFGVQIKDVYKQFMDLDIYWEGANQINGDGSWESLKFCVLACYPQEFLGDPGTQVLVGTFTINVQLPGTMTLDVGHYVQLKDCLDTMVVLDPFQCVIDVDIDIKPGSDPNPINPGSKGLVPVAILSSDVFDATQVDPPTVSIAGATVARRGKGKLMAHHEDVNADGLLDLLVQVETKDFDDLGTGGTVELTATTFGGQDIVGYDEVVIVPPHK
jgi:hypothetical protein